MKKISPNIKKKIISLAKRLGVELNWNRTPRYSYQWDGKDIACMGQSHDNIIHDIAHWAVASKKRREFPDFGLGRGPDSSKNSNEEMSQQSCDAEERKASALGIWWEKEMGLDWKATAEYHNWNNYESTHGSLESYWKKIERFK